MLAQLAHLASIVRSTGEVQVCQLPRRPLGAFAVMPVVGTPIIATLNTEPPARTKSRETVVTKT